MGIFAILGLLTIGLIATAFIGNNDDEDESPAPPDDENEIRTGTVGDDMIKTDAGNDLVFGDAGNDTLDGAGGDDIVVGESGRDLIRGSGGDDTLIGGDGDDTLTGWTGDDLLIGGAGNDSLIGGDGDDALVSVSGRDTLDGGAGNDTLIGTDVDEDFAFDETVSEPLAELLQQYYGDAATPALTDRVMGALNSHGAPGVDLLRGGDGNDLIVGDSGDTMVGGSGNDRYVVEYDGVASDFDAVTIRDFDAALERLDISLEDDVLRGDVTLAAVGSDTVVSVGGVPVAIISNTLPTAVAPTSIRLLGGMAPSMAA
ncbi:MAG: calcium-binding protein [Gemmobacter sp.]|nr:calcium-binding protein [Gemmobacter sp.]